MEDKNNNTNDVNSNGANTNDNGENGAVVGHMGSWMLAAFFSSLVRFACVNLSTADCDDDDDRPVYLTDLNDVDIDLDDIEVPV